MNVENPLKRFDRELVKGFILCLDHHFSGRTARAALETSFIVHSV